MLSASEIAAQIVSFLLLLTIMRLFLWKPFLKALDARRERIASDYKTAEDTKSDIIKVRAEYEKMISDIEITARERTQEAITQGRQIAEEIRNKASEEAQTMIDNARATLQSEITKARQDLRNDIVDITIRAAEKVVEEKLTEKEDEKIVREFIDRMDTVK